MRVWKVFMVRVVVITVMMTIKEVKMVVSGGDMGGFVAANTHNTASHLSITACQSALHVSTYWVLVEAL